MMLALCVAHAQFLHAAVAARVLSPTQAAGSFVLRRVSAACNSFQTSLRRDWRRPRSFANGLLLPRGATNLLVSIARVACDRDSIHRAEQRCPAHSNNVRDLCGAQPATT